MNAELPVETCEPGLHRVDGDPELFRDLRVALAGGQQPKQLQFAGAERGAVDEGATLVTGGRRPDHLGRGFFYEPTLLADVDPDATIAQEEVFGPVLAVIPFDGTDDDAVRIANNSIYGLSGAVMSGDPARARAVARRIRTGTLMINGGIYYGPDVPFGGFRQSGVGREMGVAGFEEYLEVKAFAEPA